MKLPPPLANWPSLLALALVAGCGRTPLDEVPSVDQPTARRDAGPGTADTGGAIGTGGATGTGGVIGTGGAIGTGGGSGGSPGTGGAIGTGGGSGGSDGGRIDGPEEPPHVICPGAVQTRPRRQVHLAGVVSGTSSWKAIWSVVAAPAGSAFARASSPGSSFDFAPDLTGDYVLRFQATDVRGNGDSCQVTVSARPLPPMVFCQREATATVGRETMLTADAKDDDGDLKVRWSVQPSTATIIPADVFVARFLATAPGRYLVTMTATDIDGAASSCNIPVLVIAAPMAMCPPSGQQVVRNNAATFSVRLDGSRMLATRWGLIKRPPGSQAQPEPTSGFSTDVTPDVLGDYLLEFVARSPDNLEARCEISFTAVSAPPMLECPDIDTTPLADTEIAVGVSDNGGIVRWDWSLDGQPPGSAARPMFPMGDSFTFKPDLAGDYKFTLKVTDDEALSASCSFGVHAAAEEGLRVEMFWDTDGTDMDLHLLSPKAKRWFDEATNQDCFYSNCTPNSPDWSEPGNGDDDPHLDLDDTDGFGPENINVDRPAAGVYRVGVHAYSGNAGKVTVRIYCGGSRLEPRATLGPFSIKEEQVWKVADVAISSDGKCDVRGLAPAAGPPTLVSRAEAEQMR